MRNLLAFVLAVAVTIVGTNYLNGVSQGTFGATLPQSPAVFETSLQSPITSSATTMTLTANTVRGGDTLSGYNCFTIDEGSAQAEFVCGTVSGTSVTAMSRGIKPSTGTTTSATLQFAHRRGANVKITDFPVIQILKAQANGQDTYPNILFYDSTSATCGVGTSNYAICGKAYIDGVAVAGASNANETTKGIIELATALENASSTATGSTGASLVAQSQFATDTPTRGCAVGYTGTAGAGCSVVAQLTGKIRQTFINLTENYTWTGTHTFSTSLISSLLTTIAASDTTTHALSLNGISYKFPSTQTASSTFLATNGSGTLIWAAPTGRAYTFATSTSISVTNGYATSTFITIPAGVLTASSTIRISGQTNCVGGAGNCQVYIQDGTGINMINGALVGVADASENSLYGMFEFTIVSNNSLTSQKNIGNSFCVNVGVPTASACNGAGIDTSINFANAFSPAVVLRSDAAATTATLYRYVIEVIP